MAVKLFDTTLRDGTQGLGVAFSVVDKVRIAKELDRLEIDYIEGGWPGSNPKDEAFFATMRDTALDHAKLVAFGSTRRAGVRPEEDGNLKAIAAAGVKAAAIFGKSWDFHVIEALGTTLEENLKMIEDSCRFLVAQGIEVIYDAEHYFDAYKQNPDYALATLQAAATGGASWLVLCDTNGGTMPWEIAEILKKVMEVSSVPVGIHAHNDCEVGVANSLEGIRAGATMVHGTINGLGERCGNANLCSIIAALELKMKHEEQHRRSLAELTRISRLISELANLVPNDRQPYVGRAAFAHKGGVHVSALLKNPATYEHIDPKVVGNIRNVLMSELAGTANIIDKAGHLGFDLGKESPQVRKILAAVKEMESEGYLFEDAEASFELIVYKAMEEHQKLFDLEGFRVINERREDGKLLSEATIRVFVEGKEYHTAGSGDGPVNALDNALRKALEGSYPQLRIIRLVDYKVRVMNSDAGTEAKVRVTIESTDGDSNWSTVGVSTNVIDASWIALLDSLEYGLIIDRRRKKS